MRSICLLISVFLLTVSTAMADSAVEMQILQEFFSTEGIVNRSIHLTVAAQEEFSRRPMVGMYLPKDAAVTFRLLVENERTAIYEAVVVHDGIAEMWSAFFLRSPLGSKLDEIRSLNLPPYLGAVEYPRLRSQSVRNSVQAARLVQLQRLFMTTELFKEDFNQNRATYDALAHLIETGQGEEAETAAKDGALVGVRFYGASKSAGEMALLVKGSEKSSGLGSEIRVSGFLDSILGLFHLPTGVVPPLMSSENYIFVEALDENWYLFRNIATEPLKEKTTKNE